MSSFSTINPATAEILKKYHHLSWEMVESKIEEAHHDFVFWRNQSFADRSQVLLRLAERLRTHKNDLAQMMNQEMGKLLNEGRQEVEKSAMTCEFYAHQGAMMLQNQKVPESPYKQAEVSFQPLGVIFSIMPWNFPLWQTIRFAAPALMAGNVILLKHADLTAGTAELIGQIFEELTTPHKLLRNIQVDHETAEKVIAHPSVQGVTFTGSSQGGRQVATAAAKNLKKIVLELGGSDAYIVFPDADLELAARTCAQVRLVNCGQSCVAGKRFIVHEKVAKAFTQYFVEELKRIELAPLASVKFQKQIIQQVEKLKQWGGTVLVGGSAPQGLGAFYPATAVLFEKNRPELHQEEVFGPVATIIVVQSEEEAISVANSSPYGLGGGLFTSDINKGKQILEKELDAGFVVLNDHVKSDPRIPFGGVKDSGYGRELSHFGIMEFVNIKTIAVGGLG